MSGGPHHGGAKYAILQEYEGHGFAPPVAYEGGLRNEVIDIVGEAEHEIRAQLSLVRVDVAKRKLSFDRPIEFMSNSEMLKDEPFVEELCEEVSTALAIMNNLRVENRKPPLGLAIEGHTSGPMKDGRIELAIGRAQKVADMLRIQITMAFNANKPPSPAPASSKTPKQPVFAISGAPALAIPDATCWGVSLSDILTVRGYGSLRPLPGTSNVDEEASSVENQRVELTLLELPLMVMVKAKAEADALALFLANQPDEPVVEQAPTRRGSRTTKRAAKDADKDAGADKEATAEEAAAEEAEPEKTAEELAEAAAIAEEEAKAAAAASAKAAKKAAKAEAAAALLGRLNVHVRGKAFAIACGEGKQSVYWLGLTAVQRYLQMPESYTTPFSHELTPVRVLARELPPPTAPKDRPLTAQTPKAAGGSGRPGTAASAASGRGDVERWRWLPNGAKLGECGLSAGDHVWVDVGDGGPPGVLSDTLVPSSRPFSAKPKGVVRDEREGEAVVRLERVGFSAHVDPLAITGEQCFLDATEQDPDARPSLSFGQVARLPSACLVGDYSTWLAKRKEKAGEANDDAFDDFKRLFDAISISDLSGYSTWVSDVRGVLWGRYDLLVYCFYSHGGAKGSPQDAVPYAGKQKAKDERHGTITVLDCWDFVRACALTSPTFALNELDHTVPDHDMLRRKKLELIHQPESRVSLAEFVEMLVRLALANQPDPLKPAKELKDALKDVFELHVVPVYEPPIPSTCLGDHGVEPLTPLDSASRRMLRLHAPSLAMIFQQWAADDETGCTIRLREADAVFEGAGLYKSRTPDEAFTQRDLVRCFASMVLSGWSEPAEAEWLKRHAPNLPKMPEPSRDASTGRGNLLAGGGLLAWEFDELVGRVALQKYRKDTTTPDHMKVNELCLLLRTSLAPKRTKGGSKRAALPWLTAPPMEYAYDPSVGNGARLILPRPIDEAKANAERVAAVAKLLHVRAPPPKGGGGKDAKKDAGKKKK